jgi:glutamate-ammonia-ligase adenylyltransferase
VITAKPALAARVEAVLRDILTRPRDLKRLVKDVSEMRARIAQQYPGNQFWDLKYRPGGMIDVEFIAQYLQLRHAAEDASVLHTNTTEALRRLAAAGFLPAAMAEDLIAASRLWHILLGMLRLTVGTALDEASLAAGVSRALVSAGGATDFDALKAKVDATAARVRGHFIDVIDKPAAAG